jgi:hypothetical protein
MFEKYIMELNRWRRLIWSNNIRLALLALWILLLLPAFVSVGMASTRLATLPGHFGIGVKNGQLELSWMTNSGVPWDYRNQYLNPGWESWSSPSGSFVLNYAKQGYIPVFTWYVIGGSSWGNPYSGLFTSLPRPGCKAPAT